MWLQVISMAQTGQEISSDMLKNADLENVSPPNMEGLEDLISVCALFSYQEPISICSMSCSTKLLLCSCSNSCSKTVLCHTSLDIICIYPSSAKELTRISAKF
jgi:hypothetical protein